MYGEIIELSLEYPRATGAVVTGAGYAVYTAGKRVRENGIEGALEGNHDLPTEEEMKDEWEYVDDSLEDEIEK